MMKKRRLLDELHETARGLARIDSLHKQTMRKVRRRRDLFAELTLASDCNPY
jgi:hypothetical protein